MTARLRDRVRAALYPGPPPVDPFERIVRDASRTLRPVLDFGAGRGAVAGRFAPADNFVVGADVDRQIRANRTLDARVVFDGAHLPFRDGACACCGRRGGW